MSVMRAPEIPGIWADPDRVLTVEDMEDTPDDEFRYELDEGMLIVSPAPSLPHQIAIMQLAFALKTACPPGLLVVAGPGVNINKFQHRVPDLVVIRRESVTPMFLTEPPVLAVEVASPRTRLYDRGRKRDVYEQFGIRSYWIVDVDQDKPGLTVLELRRGKYTEAARVVGDEAFSAVRPFPVTIVPADLLDAEPS
jgi:Uma2 family endonuclease